MASFIPCIIIIIIVILMIVIINIIAAFIHTHIFLETSSALFVGFWAALSYIE